MASPPELLSVGRRSDSRKLAEFSTFPQRDSSLTALLAGLLA
jgi:hypothetical protein